jgi:hypothetical protein
MLMLVAGLFFTSCKGGKGPAGPDGSNGSVLIIFKQDSQPTLAYMGSIDSYISSGSQNFNYGSSTGAPVGPAGILGINRMLIKFDLSNDLPSNAVITKASLELYCYFTGSGNSNTITAYRVTQSWLEGSANGIAAAGAAWSTDGVNPWTGGSFDIAAGPPVFCSAADEGTYVVFPVNPGIIQSWVDDPSQNNGLLLKGDNEDTSVYDSIAFYTKENVAFAPVLKIYYNIN